MASPLKPKKGMSAYLYFCNEMRPVIKEELPNIASNEIMKELGRRWRLLSDEEKKPYNDMASVGKVNKSPKPKSKKASKKPKKMSKKQSKPKSKSPKKQSKKSKKTTPVNSPSPVCSVVCSPARSPTPSNLCGISPVPLDDYEEIAKLSKRIFRKSKRINKISKQITDIFEKNADLEE